MCACVSSPVPFIKRNKNKSKEIRGWECWKKRGKNIGIAGLNTGWHEVVINGGRERLQRKYSRRARTSSSPLFLPPLSLLLKAYLLTLLSCIQGDGIAGRRGYRKDDKVVIMT